MRDQKWLEKQLLLINERFFKSKSRAKIRWGRKPRSGQCKVSHLGYCLAYVDPDTGRLHHKEITVSQRLQRRWVPTSYIRFLIYHELIHARGIHHHGPSFQRIERAYPAYKRIMKYERKNMNKMLRWP